jgi:DNA repair exonuclease SbcCD nuclease subunit
MTLSRRKILHTSDLHLTSQIEGTGEETPAQLGLINVVDAAGAHEVDLILIAGDLFDNNRVRDAAIEFASRELARAHCPVVLITGNHDCYTDHSIYHRMDMASIGSHLYFLTREPGEWVEFDELHIRVWGRGIVDHHPEHKPLAADFERDGDYWHIGMTHGYFSTDDKDYYSSRITSKEIHESNFDYLALGHVHVFRDVSQGNTRACYSGSPACNPHLPGGAAALVSFDPSTGVDVEKLDLG